MKKTEKKPQASEKHRRAVFPGSFDPLTYGHVDLISRALEIFDSVLIAVLINPAKDSLFTPEERVRLIEMQFKEFGSRIEVECFSGLLVEFAAERGIRVILRGLRAISDFDYEAQMALMNRNLSEEIETLFLMTREKYSYISSSLVKQIAPFGGDVTRLVPPGVARALKKKFALRGK